MTSPEMKPWLQVSSLHPDVLSPSFSEDVFALDLGPLADGNPNVPPVYRDPAEFFRATYMTAGLRSLLGDVLARLDGTSGNRVLKLVTPFGGGKSHTLAALLHAARGRDYLDGIPDGSAFAHPQHPRVAVFDGQFFDASVGKEMLSGGGRASTMWGWIASSLGGPALYDKVRLQDETRVAPGGDVILEMLKDGPNLILLDEVLNYLISAGGVQVHDTNLRLETLTFLERLTVAVSNTRTTVLVYSLQSSKRESLEHAGLLGMLDHLAARKEQSREPVEKDEILQVIQRRLLARPPTMIETSAAANAFQEVLVRMRRGYAGEGAPQYQADEEGILLHDRIRLSYPFHPALIDIMRERWSAIPDFQRTRGALRFLAACLRSAHSEGGSRVLLGPGDVPLHDAEVRLAFFKEVGQQSDFQAVLEHDLLGANARARRIDDRRARESPTEVGKRPASRVATAILMYSFGGLRRQGSSTGEFLPPGVSEAELLSACVAPDLDSTTIQACLKELRESCLYLHYDGVRYAFKKDPNVTLLIEQEAEAIGRDQTLVRSRVELILAEHLAGRAGVILWPANSKEVPDGLAVFQVAYLPLDFPSKGKGAQEAIARDLMDNYGGNPRKYRNGLGLAIPSKEQVEGILRSTTYLIATEQVRNASKRHNLTPDQLEQLKERNATEQTAIESATLRLYADIWLPAGSGAIEKITCTNRPLRTTFDSRRHALVHERMLELLTGPISPTIFASIVPSKLSDLFNLGTGSPPRLFLKVSDVVDGFFGIPGFPRLVSGEVIRTAIARGVVEGHFGVLSGPEPGIGSDQRVMVSPDRVALSRPLRQEEIELEGTYLIHPTAIPQNPTEAATTPEPVGGGGGQAPSAGAPSHDSPVTGVSMAQQNHVDLAFSANRDELYAAWGAIANLADLAGKVDLVVKATSSTGLDKRKLENGVLEPLREANLIE